MSREPQTKREWRVAWLSALDQRDIARAEADRLRDAIEHHCRSVYAATSDGDIARADRGLWAALDDDTP